MSFEREIGIALEALQWKSSSSCTEHGISWFFSSCGGKFGIHLELRQGPQGTSPVALGKSGLLSQKSKETKGTSLLNYIIVIVLLF